MTRIVTISTMPNYGFGVMWLLGSADYTVLSSQRSSCIGDLRIGDLSIRVWSF
jgi:hypothetical protein